MTDPLMNLLRRLSDNGVDYVLIGGMAAILHGANVVTRDVDVVTSMELENILRRKRRYVRCDRAGGCGLTGWPSAKMLTHYAA